MRWNLLQEEMVMLPLIFWKATMRSVDFLWVKTLLIGNMKKQNKTNPTAFNCPILCIANSRSRCKKCFYLRIKSSCPKLSCKLWWRLGKKKVCVCVWPCTKYPHTPQSHTHVWTKKNWVNGNDGKNTFSHTGTDKNYYCGVIVIQIMTPKIVFHIYFVVTGVKRSAVLKTFYLALFHNSECITCHVVDQTNFLKGLIEDLC